MSDDSLKESADRVGERMMARIASLYPICRSITGNGVRETLRRIGEEIPLKLHEVPTGTKVFDWEVPREWNIRDAWIKTPDGRKIARFREHNLHVLNYSVPIHEKMDLEALRPHLFTMPEHPDWIPYKTSYYRDNWGFCLSHNEYLTLPEGEYEVYIDSSLEPGSLTYGELLIPGESEREVLLSCHVCHPSLANDNLSGIALMTELGKWLREQPRRYSYRLLFIPGTIGSITWLARNEEKTERIEHGLVVTCVGDPGAFTYKKSRRGNAFIDRAVLHLLRQRGEPFNEIDFYPYGYDERQYCSPGFNLPVGSLSRSSHGQYPEYHTSADNLDLVDADSLAASLALYREVVEIIESNAVYVSLNPKCEPQLGKRGLYSQIGGPSGSRVNEMALLWVLNLADGEHDLLDMAERSGHPHEEIRRAAEALEAAELLRRVPAKAANPSSP